MGNFSKGHLFKIDFHSENSDDLSIISEIRKGYKKLSLSKN